MKVNQNVAVGTRVGFGPSSRLRRVVADEKTKSNRLTEHEMSSGVLIGEGKKGTIVARVAQNDMIGYVVDVDGGHFGWTYNFEFHIV